MVALCFMSKFTKFNICLQVIRRPFFSFVNFGKTNGYCYHLHSFIWVVVLVFGIKMCMQVVHFWGICSGCEPLICWPKHD